MIHPRCIFSFNMSFSGLDSLLLGQGREIERGGGGGGVGMEGWREGGREGKEGESK